MRMLLEAGADVNARNRNGDTPLHLVALNNARYEVPGASNQVAALLLADGADLGAKDRQGKTPASLVKDRNNKDLGNLLRPKPKVR